MQLQGLMLMLLMLVIFPVIILFSSHNIFFIVIALILFISSIRSLHASIFRINVFNDETDDELVEEVESMVNLDVKRFGTGIKVARDLIVILFYLYSNIYVSNFSLKIVTAGIIIYWIYDLVNAVATAHLGNHASNKTPFKRFVSIIVSIASILLIIFVTCNKFIRIMF